MKEIDTRFFYSRLRSGSYLAKSGLQIVLVEESPQIVCSSATANEVKCSYPANSLSEIFGGRLLIRIGQILFLIWLGDELKRNLSAREELRIDCLWVSVNNSQRGPSVPKVNQVISLGCVQ